MLFLQDRSRLYKQNLFQLLLGVYLQPEEKCHEPLVRPALSLLNSHGAAFNAAQVRVEAFYYTTSVQSICSIISGVGIAAT